MVGRLQNSFGDQQGAQTIGQHRHPFSLFAGEERIGVGDEGIEGILIALRVPGRDAG